MKFTIKHENRSRMRIRAAQRKMTYEQADLLEYYLMSLDGVKNVRVHERTCDAEFTYQGNRSEIIHALQIFHYDEVKAPEGLVEHSVRPLNAEFTDKLFHRVLFFLTRKALWQFDALKKIKIAYNWAMSLKYFKEGLKSLSHGKLEVSVLDATAILVSMLRGDYSTAGSVRFLLSIGDLLEDWTRKRSMGDLARVMSLNVSDVWVRQEDGTEVLLPIDEVHSGDEVDVHTGSTIPFDGTVLFGEAMVNQAALTGESLPVRKVEEDSVYAGTAVEEGEVVFRVSKTGGDSKYEQIVHMIEGSENLKSSVESKAYHMADKLVPYTLGTSILTYLFSRNLEKAVSVLMVDFSCALKLSIPISVISAMREASGYGITVKGGKFLEAVSSADTIVFDKTGTLTRAQPTVREVISFDGEDPDELLRMAACLEEHFPHSIANAVVKAAKDKGLNHEELHTKVEYVIAHGIASSINGKRALIGSYHFLFEDEGIVLPEDKRELWESIPDDCSQLYMALDGKLIAVILIEDPLREEAQDVIHALKQNGFQKVVMMTGDSERTARSIASQVGVDQYFAEVLPEDKASFVEQERRDGHSVVMIGDGINDSPALSAASVGIAISDGAEIAREVADITMNGESLENIIILKKLADGLMDRINRNYHFIVGFNGSLIGLGIAGLLQPQQSALLHNGSTIIITLLSMRNLLE